MKLQFQKLPKGVQADTLSISKSILTQNEIETDLDTVAVFEQDEEGTLTQPDIYKDSDGMIHILIRVDNDRFFMAMGGKFKDLEGVEYTYHNYLLYHDADLNGDIDAVELADFIGCYNATEEERSAEHKAVWDAFTGKPGTRLSQLTPEKRVEWLMRGVPKK